MGRMTTYIVMISGLLIVFHIFGLVGADTVNSDILHLMVEPQDIINVNFWKQTVLAIELVAAATTLVVGTLLGRRELAYYAIFTLFLVNFLWDGLAVYNAVRAASPVIAVLLFGPMIVLMVATVFEFWRGTDSG